jgi:transposase-like protein
LEKAPDADLMREMIGFAAQRLVELEVESLIGAGYGEKSSERRARRNGYRGVAGALTRNPRKPWPDQAENCTLLYG